MALLRGGWSPGGAVSSSPGWAPTLISAVPGWTAPGPCNPPIYGDRSEDISLPIMPNPTDKREMRNQSPSDRGRGGEGSRGRGLDSGAPFSPLLDSGVSTIGWPRHALQRDLSGHRPL
ncbi:hypothetical protein SUGI_1509770 [Cryptomeria japonica]|uniref:Uncharacterized protein n=1 Tax=Cryptomeria japonica TaxID=3369 RepID=A0AAD3NVU2_CRYJA|nr:hypothetical protein SUGI_1508120 [Cryptomeria japonica]GLJ59471.1 hypothetical protein SUGI_1509770 [Cryptomeria japonica]